MSSSSLATTTSTKKRGRPATPPATTAGTTSLGGTAAAAGPGVATPGPASGHATSPAAPRSSSKRPIDEPGLAEALKRTRISCAPGELRMKNDVAALERSDLVRRGHVGVAPLGSNALVLSIADDRFLVTVTQRYPFEPPTVRQIRSNAAPVRPPEHKGPGVGRR